MKRFILFGSVVEEWLNKVGVTTSGSLDSGTGRIEKTGGTNGLWDAGASSIKRLQSGDGYMQFTVPALSQRIMVGLGERDANASFTLIDYTVFLETDNTMDAYENGGHVYTGPSFAVGDVFRINIASGVVTYQRQVGGAGAFTTLYTSSLAVTYPLGIEVSIYQSNSYVTNIGFSGNWS